MYTQIQCTGTPNISQMKRRLIRPTVYKQHLNVSERDEAAGKNRGSRYILSHIMKARALPQKWQRITLCVVVGVLSHRTRSWKMKQHFCEKESVSHSIVSLSKLRAKISMVDIKKADTQILHLDSKARQNARATIKNLLQIIEAMVKTKRYNLEAEPSESVISVNNHLAYEMNI